MQQPAVVNYASVPLSVELRDVHVPEISEDAVLLQVDAVAVCGSEIHQWQGTHSWDVNYPVILSHEFAGTVAAVGARVAEFSVGDRVVSETAAVIDPHSSLSRQGLYNLDPVRKGFGYGVDGAMTHFVCVPTRCLHHVPPVVPLFHAALAEPCNVAYNAVVNHASVRPGDYVVVLGPGPIGLLCGLMARLRGAAVAVIGLPHDRERLDIAVRLGMFATEAVSRDWGGSLGVHGVIDATGVSAALHTALQIVRPAGWITKVGWGPEPLVTRWTCWSGKP